MANKKTVLLAAALLGLVFTASAQSKILHDTIPFEIVQNKFIFQASIDGKPVRLILDTGGQNVMVSDSADYYGVNIIRNQTIADVNDTHIQTMMGSVNNFKIGRWMKWDVGKMTIVPNHQFLRDLGVAGAVGGEAFSNVCLSIDRRNKRFTVSYPYRPNNISRKAGTLMNMGNSYHAIVPVRIGNEEIDVLFDSGSSGFLSLGVNDFEKLQAQTGNVEKRQTGHGILYVGVAGINEALSDSIYNVHIPALTLPGGKELHHIGTLVGQHSTTIAGQQLFDYGVVMFDYPRGLFYFFPHETAPSDVSAVTKSWNVKILPIVDHFEVVATIGDIDLRVGERVWSINGTDLTPQKLSESLVLDLLESTATGTATITVGADKKQLRTISIKKI